LRLRRKKNEEEEEEEIEGRRMQKEEETSRSKEVFAVMDGSRLVWNSGVEVGGGEQKKEKTKK
jgi:hypothetical protein